MQRRGTSLWAAGLAVFACLTACTGGGSVPGARATATAGTGTETESGDSAEATPGGPTPTPGVFEADSEVLDVAISEPATLDPMRIRDPGSVLVARQLYEGLTRWDPVQEEVRGFAAVNQQGTATHLAGLSAPDKRTLVVELSEPMRDFPSVLTHPSL